MNPHPSTILRSLEQRARKRFGQNFLCDERAVAHIADLSGAAPGVKVLEIGPGLGALTRVLSARRCELTAVELDRDLADFLEKRFARHDNVAIHQQDILKFDLAALINRSSKLRIIGNLPYNISTPVMFHLLQNAELIEDMTFMLQLEVVQRLGAKPGNKNYGRLGIMVQYFCEVEHLFNVPSAAFTPKPKVSSAIVRLTPHARREVEARSVEALQTVVRTAFNLRRKTLKNSLKAIMSAETLAQVPVSLSERPENLSLSDYVAISDLFAQELNQSHHD